MFPRGDDTYGTVPINFNFKYFVQSHSQIYISTNGFVSFGGIVSSVNASGNAISALNYDLDTRTSGGIYYQNLNYQSGDFNSIKSDINRLNPTFVPTNLLRITFDNVPIYLKSSKKVSFQIILASDASKSYVLLKYKLCALDNLGSIPGVYYLSTNGQQMKNQMTINPCTVTNVNLMGTWVFDVSPSNGKSVIFFLSLENLGIKVIPV